MVSLGSVMKVKPFLQAHKSITSSVPGGTLPNKVKQRTTQSIRLELTISMVCCHSLVASAVL